MIVLDICEIHSRKKTGGGTPPKPLDSETEKVLFIVNDNTKLVSPFDSESSLARNADVVGEAIQLSGLMMEEVEIAEVKFEIPNPRSLLW